MLKKKKIRDTVDYSNLAFNPFIMDDSISEILNGEGFDFTLVDHRRRHAERKQRQKDRQELADKLGVVYEPKLTPLSEILPYLTKIKK